MKKEVEEIEKKLNSLLESEELTLEDQEEIINNYLELLDKKQEQVQKEENNLTISQIERKIKKLLKLNKLTDEKQTELINLYLELKDRQSQKQKKQFYTIYIAGLVLGLCLTSGISIHQGKSSIINEFEKITNEYEIENPYEDVYDIRYKGKLIDFDSGLECIKEKAKLLGMTDQEIAIALEEKTTEEVSKKVISKEEYPSTIKKLEIYLNRKR